MVFYPQSAVERTMEMQEVILRAMAKARSSHCRGVPIERIFAAIWKRTPRIATKMEQNVTKILGTLLLVSAVALAQAPVAKAPVAQAPALKPVGTVDDLMISVIRPISDEVFYITTRDTPKNEEQWRLFQGRMLMLAESANLLMMPGRAWDNDGWMKDSQRLYDAGSAAYKAAKAHDLDKIAGLSDQMYAACVGCHNDYRPNYRKRPLTPEPVPQQ